MIAVVGLGFVGLTTALGLAAKAGLPVYGLEKDAVKRETLKEGKLPFYEPGLDEYLNKHLGDNFFVTEDVMQAIDKSRVIFFCVGTPTGEKGEADLDILFDAIKDILQYVEKGNHKTLVIKSTVPPSTTRERIAPYIEKLGYVLGKDISLVNNPEFLREGYAWLDFMEPDRIVIGEVDDQGADIIEDIYTCFNAPIVRVSSNTSEFIKYVSNTLLGTLISFSNELSMLSQVIGDIDVAEAFKGIHMDKRWSGHPGDMCSYVYPGCGFGGYCLPKDIKAIISLGESRGYTPYLLKSAMVINNKIKENLFNKITRKASRGEKIGILGLSFKPNSDDVRESPAKDIIELLLKDGYEQILAYDPMAMDNFQEAYELPIDYAGDLEEVLEQCHVVVIITAWDEFIKNMHNISNRKVIDGRYCL